MSICRVGSFQCFARDEDVLQTVWWHLCSFTTTCELPNYRKRSFYPPSFSIFSSIINIMYELIRKTWSLALWDFHYLKTPQREWLWASSPSSLMWELLSFRAFFPLCFTLAMKKKKLKKIGKSPVKPNLPISCCFTVKASKLYQNSLHCFYANAVFDGTGFWKSFFTCDGSVKYIPLV